MASVTGSSISFASLNLNKRTSSSSLSSLRSISVSANWKFVPSFTLRTKLRQFNICCAAKKETVEKVCEIVKKQLALPDGSDITGESKFSALGADSLDTVEIVMGLEEEFGIVVEEDSAQSITTVQEAADLIEKIMERESK